MHFLIKFCFNSVQRIKKKFHLILDKKLMQPKGSLHQKNGLKWLNIAF